MVVWLCVYCAKKTQLVPKKNLPKAMSAAKILFAKKVYWYVYQTAILIKRIDYMAD